jgi:hypothetical protein
VFDRENEEANTGRGSSKSVEDIEAK